jgi:hypothetical protein
VARTVTCDQCGVTRPVTESILTGGWADWLTLQSAALEHGARDFCSLACLSAWVVART